MRLLDRSILLFFVFFEQIFSPLDSVEIMLSVILFLIIHLFNKSESLLLIYNSIGACILAKLHSAFFKGVKKRIFLV
jgi:hypothetical protein